MSDLLDSLGRYLKTARWFGGKGRPMRVRGVESIGTISGPEQVSVCLVTVEYDDVAPDSPERTECYQVPIVLRDETAADRGDRIGPWSDSPGELQAYDALPDGEAMRGWLGAFADQAADGSLRFRSLPGTVLDPSTPGVLFTGEQSNSSVAFGTQALMKVFRKVTPGENPDVVIHEVLTRCGARSVAALYGWVEGIDPASGQVLQLAMLQEYLAGATDGWDLARDSVRRVLSGSARADDFDDHAARLGSALAEVHQALAEHFPTAARDAGALAALADTMTDRLTAAIDVAPELTSYAGALGRTFAAVADLDPVPIQRVHGDLHLGQTLLAGERWRIVDFEGEPAKSLSERVLPDSPWRDVAGMVRSFDYAPQSVLREQPTTEPGSRSLATAWTEAASSAFLSAYAGRELLGPAEQTLLAAYLADKAVYETVYEVRNRPDWVEIPLAAIARIGAQ